MGVNMSNNYEFTSQKELRRAFWIEFPNLSRRKISYNGEKIYIADTRFVFIDWIDGLERYGKISNKLAQRVTL